MSSDMSPWKKFIVKSRLLLKVVYETRQALALLTMSGDDLGALELVNTGVGMALAAYCGRTTRCP